MDTGYIVETIGEKRVAEYLGITLLEVGELNFVDYLFFKREAVIYNCSQTEEGREYLRNAKKKNSMPSGGEIENNTPRRNILMQIY